MALKQLPKPQWHNWIQQLLLLLGSSLFMAGVIFFFAYNWAAMSPIYKFSLIQCAILLLAGTSHYLGRNTLSGQTALAACVVMIGVLMAVFGQIYQTGADSYELFLGWAVLGFGLVVYSRFSGLWLIWLIICTTGILLFWDQVAHPGYKLSYPLCFLILASFHTCGLIFFETGVGRRHLRQQGAWLNPLLLAVILTFLTLPVLELIFSWQQAEPINQLNGVIWLLTLSLSFLYYRFKRPDFLAIFLVLTTACIIVTLSLCRLFFVYGFHSHVDEGIFLISGMVILALVGITAMWLKRIHQTMENKR